MFYKLDSSPEPVSPSLESRSSSSSSYQPGIHSPEAFPSIHSQAFEACNNTSGTQPATPATPLPVMPRSTFSTCGNFIENTEISEAKWLRKFDFNIKDCQDVKGPFPPDRYLRYLDMLLIENASNWSESNPKAIRLLAEPEMIPTQQIIQQFRAVFCERFPSKAVKATYIPSDIEITELRQRPEETLSTYYKRVLNLMQRVRAKDRPASTPNTAFTLLESSMLDIILRASIRGLNNHEIRKEATRDMASTDRSLYMIYNLAEEARRTNAEIQKLLNEKVKSDQLSFYKSLVERNVSKQQVASLLASHQASRMPKPLQHHAWSFHQDPPQHLPS